MKKPAWVACCLTTVITLAGCGGTSGTSPAKQDTLADLFGAENPAAQQAQFERQLRTAEAKIATCMRAEGFEYTPSVPANSFQIPPQPKKGDEVAFKRKNGYGFSTMLAVPSGSNTVAKDPNKVRLSKMKEGDRAAYEQALYGGSADALSDDVDLGSGGCQGKAFAEQQQAWAPLQAKFEKYQRNTEADPEIKRLDAKFASCMTKAGFVIGRESEIYEKILGPEQSKLYMQPADATVTSLAPDETQALPSIAPAALEEFRVFEMKVANADADCRSQKDFDKVAVLREGYERAFVEENRALLEKARDTFE